MQTAVRSKAVVQPGGRVEITDSQLPDGAEVDVIVLVAAGVEKRSAVDILRELPGQRIFKTAEEVDAYIREERASWER